MTHLGGNPQKGGEFGLEMLTTAREKRPSPDFEEGFRKLKECLRNALGRLRVGLRKTSSILSF